MPTIMNPREPGARKTAFVTIDADNRDRGKRFLLTEMPATQAERWFRKLVAYLAQRGITVPGEMIGMAAMATPGFISPLQMFSWLDDEPLIAELMSTVQAWPPGAPIARGLVENDTEEVLTLLQLKMEVLALHVGFSLAVVLWTVMPQWAAAMNLPKPPTPPEASSDTQTFPTQ